MFRHRSCRMKTMIIVGHVAYLPMIGSGRGFENTQCFEIDKRGESCLCNFDMEMTL